MPIDPIKNPIKSYLEGMLHGFSYINLYSGEKSLGDRIMNYTMPLSKGPVDNPIIFISGMTTELLLEVGIPLYAATSADLNLYQVLAIDAAIKLIPRGLDLLISNRKNITSK